MNSDFAKQNYDNKDDEYFGLSRPEMIEFLPEKFSSVLDVGCGDGHFGVLLKSKFECELVWGVEFDDDSAEKAKLRLDNVLNGTIEENLDQLPDLYFDCIFFNDVLEHLLDPYSVLKKIKTKLKDDGVVISSIPNIRYFRNLFDFVLHKNWDYTDSGIMDFTHFRFFTVKSIRKMYEGAGYEVIQHKGINKTKSIRPALLNFFTLGKFWDIGYLQFATVAKRKAGN